MNQIHQSKPNYWVKQLTPGSVVFTKTKEAMIPLFLFFDLRHGDSISTFLNKNKKLNDSTFFLRFKTFLNKPPYVKVCDLRLIKTGQPIFPHVFAFLSMPCEGGYVFLNVTTFFLSVHNIGPIHFNHCQK